jgi:hypothetical protein
MGQFVVRFDGSADREPVEPRGLHRGLEVLGMRSESAGKGMAEPKLDEAAG